MPTFLSILGRGDQPAPDGHCSQVREGAGAIPGAGSAIPVEYRSTGVYLPVEHWPRVDGGSIAGAPGAPAPKKWGVSAAPDGDDLDSAVVTFAFALGDDAI